MGVGISRDHFYQLAVAVTNSLSTTPDIPIGDWAAGGITIPTGSSLTSLAVYVADREPSDPLPSVPAQNAPTAPTYYPLHDATDAAIVMTVSATSAQALPAAIFAFGSVKLVGNAAGTITVSKKA